MTPKDKADISRWLDSDQDYTTGVALYCRVGLNRMLRRRFQVERTAQTHRLLVRELTRLAAERVPGAAEASGSPKPPTTADSNTPVTESTRAVMRFRERFPFLRAPDCPAPLKIAANDMFAARDRYTEAHARLRATAADEVAESLCENIVKDYLENRDIWDELEHYKDHGTILGKSEALRAYIKQEDLATIPDIELMKKINSARVNMSKRKTALTKARTIEEREAVALQLQKWQLRRAELEAEVERRKKNSVPS